MCLRPQKIKQVKTSTNESNEYSEELQMSPNPLKSRAKSEIQILFKP